MNYQKIILYAIALFVFSAHCEQKILNFIPAKNPKENKSIIPFNADFFNEIKNIFNATIFIETGTYLGDTCEIARNIFEQIYTVELSDSLFNSVYKRFAQTPQIKPYHGDSGIVLGQILAQVPIDQRIVILLDSHWSGGETAHGFDVPILRELETIKKSGIKNSIILIDDLRCFQNQPPQSPDPYQYPDLTTILKYLAAINNDYKCAVYGDLLLAYADNDITIPLILQATTISRLNMHNDSMLSQAELVISNANDQDFDHLAWLATKFDTSTGIYRTHFYDFWYALGLHNRGYKIEADHYMKRAARAGFARANYYLNLWKKNN